MNARAPQAECLRLFEAEAVRDGRISGAERARFEAHLGVCARCAHEVQVLDELAKALRASVDVAQTNEDELHTRRERTRLIAAFDASLVPAQSRGRARVWVVTAFASATVAALCALVLVIFASSPESELGLASRAANPVDVQADGTARWSRRADNGVETVTLQSGTLSIHVDHALSPRRLLVKLPDGELEDIGTTFSVSADAGRTTRVSVQDGKVVLRLQGKLPLALSAGDSWQPAPETTVAPSLAVALPLAQQKLPAPAVSHAKSAGDSAAAPAGRSAPASDNNPGGTSDSVSTREPGNDFRVAMAALNAGNNTSAASLFAAFLGEHPRDPRAEDAAYLRVIALQRAGESRSMKRAAAEYLSRHPSGFRRAEIAPLAR